MAYVQQLPTPPAETLRPIGPVRTSKHTASLAGLPPLVLGGAQFNHQYNSDPFSLPVKDIVRQCFEVGVCAIDTSAYYGPSEVLLGEALADAEIAELYPRDTYFLITKAGRVAEATFDYRPEAMRASVERSLQRLRTSYLDVVYAHDVEFVPLADALGGIAELFRLKAEGVIRNVGISGYPLDVLLALVRRVRAELGFQIDVVLSYSNFTLQNRRLQAYVDEFEAAGVRHVLNGSPLSMSLLRSQPPHAFHPARAELKARVADAAQLTASRNVELADLAMRYALANWSRPTVVGWSTLFEVERGVQAYWDSRNDALLASDAALIDGVHAILAETLDETWPSGIEHDAVPACT
ncbi:NADP-dependent oxidoreductase domain-containing protein [Dipodascopsis tothii]|uniref:NADP-dependent oxidoreductase domain-containing protein n=1 Tax=Dipodascopsis tothii TaxID=44089 RepID=UPI0034CDB055